MELCKKPDEIHYCPASRVLTTPLSIRNALQVDSITYKSQVSFAGEVASLEFFHTFLAGQYLFLQTHNEGFDAARAACVGVFMGHKTVGRRVPLQVNSTY